MSWDNMVFSLILEYQKENQLVYVTGLELYGYVESKISASRLFVSWSYYKREYLI